MSSKEDLRNLDWDDSVLIKAYEEGMKLKKGSLSKSEKKNPPVNEKKKTESKWKVGNCCRALYSVDKKWYEAKISAIENDWCTIDFLGYGDAEEVELKNLKPSFGKSARKKQIRKVSGYTGYSSAVESETGDDTTEDTTTVSRASSHSSTSRKHQESHVANRTRHDYSMTDTTLHVPQDPAPYYAPPPQVQMQNVPYLPSVPPMPPCPGAAQGAAMSSMLSSWYMAGYYTGLHQGSKTSQCAQRCCNHGNNCCRN